MDWMDCRMDGGMDGGMDGRMDAGWTVSKILETGWSRKVDWMVTEGGR